MTLIQVKLFERDDQKKNYKMSFFVDNKHHTEIFYLRLFLLGYWLDWHIYTHITLCIY